MRRNGFLDAYNFPKLNHEDMKHLKRHITIEEIKITIKIKSQPQVHSLVSFQTSKEELLSILFRKSKNRNSPTQFLQSKHEPDTKTDRQHMKKDDYRPKPLMSIHSNILNKYTNKLNLTTH